MSKITEAFEAWWADTGEQSLFALNTTTDDDIKILAGLAWEAAIREALTEPVKQEPVAIVKVQKIEGGPAFHYIDCQHLPPDTKLYLAPVRTKDLTDAEVEAIMVEQGDLRTTAFARAVIAADRKINK